MSARQWSVADIRLLAKTERKMDNGTQPFVLHGGHRWAFSAELLEHLGVEPGQTVDSTILREIMQANILNLKHQLEIEECGAND